MNTFYALAIFAVVIATLAIFYFVFTLMQRQERHEVIMQQTELEPIGEQVAQAQVSPTQVQLSAAVPVETTAPMPNIAPTTNMNPVPETISPAPEIIPAPVVPPAPIAPDGTPLYEQPTELIERSPILDVANPIVPPTDPQ